LGGEGRRSAYPIAVGRTRKSVPCAMFLGLSAKRKKAILPTSPELGKVDETQFRRDCLRCEFVVSRPSKAP
jgi:hypothetical protein